MFNAIQGVIMLIHLHGVKIYAHLHGVKIYAHSYTWCDAYSSE